MCTFDTDIYRINFFLIELFMILDNWVKELEEIFFIIVAGFNKESKCSFASELSFTFWMK